MELDGDERREHFKSARAEQFSISPDGRWIAFIEGFRVFVSLNYNWNWGIFFQTSADGSHTWLATLLIGLCWTLLTALCAGVIALLLGSIIGVMRTTSSKWALRLGNVYVELFRNVPLLVQLFLWFFVVPELLPKDLGTAIKQMTPPWASFVPAVIGLGLFTAARVAEQVRAGIQALPRGQGMAGTALGLTVAQTYRYILLPMAFRIIMPPLTSETMNLIKNTSVALTIGLIELTAAARSMQEFTFQVFEAFTAATVLYILVNIVVVLGMRWVEQRVAVPGLISARGPQAGH
jgi:glutamate/aspartate transport system permease protein